MEIPFFPSTSCRWWYLLSYTVLYYYNPEINTIRPSVCKIAPVTLETRCENSVSRFPDCSTAWLRLSSRRLVMQPDKDNIHTSTRWCGWLAMTEGCACRRGFDHFHMCGSGQVGLSRLCGKTRDWLNRFEPWLCCYPPGFPGGSSWHHERSSSRCKRQTLANPHNTTELSGGQRLWYQHCKGSCPR